MKKIKTIRIVLLHVFIASLLTYLIDITVGWDDVSILLVGAMWAIEAALITVAILLHIYKP